MFYSFSLSCANIKHNPRKKSKGNILHNINFCVVAVASPYFEMRHFAAFLSHNADGRRKIKSDFLWIVWAFGDVKKTFRLEIVLKYGAKQHKPHSTFITGL